MAATSDIFSVLGVAPLLGRGYTRAEDSRDARVVVFTYDAWQRHFNGDPNIIGRQVRLALRPYTVIGVMPRSFRYPVDAQGEFFMPMHPLVATAVRDRGAHFFRVIGRLRPGVSPARRSGPLPLIWRSNIRTRTPAAARMLFRYMKI